MKLNQSPLFFVLSPQFPPSHDMTADKLRRQTLFSRQGHGLSYGRHFSDTGFGSFVASKIVGPMFYPVAICWGATSTFLGVDSSVNPNSTHSTYFVFMELWGCPIIATMELVAFCASFFWFFFAPFYTYFPGFYHMGEELFFCVCMVPSKVDNDSQFFLEKTNPSTGGSPKSFRPHSIRAAFFGAQH